jgi:methylated-DNA-[protein]-cysteine S-methyltransferase
MRPRRDAAQHYLMVETAIGCCGIAWSARGLTRLRLPDSDPQRTERRLAASAVPCHGAPPSPVARLIADLRRYATGEAVDFSALDLDLGGIAPFERAVYAAARSVGWGETTTYGALARQAGASSPEAARDVGQAMARNPVPIVIPCHRVLASGNGIGGFSAPGGAATKLRLLALEGVRLDGGQLALPGL